MPVNVIQYPLEIIVHTNLRGVLCDTLTNPIKSNVKKVVKITYFQSKVEIIDIQFC